MTAALSASMRLALFDFDGTLTTRDSLMPFLRGLVGTPRFVAGIAACSGPLLAYATGRLANDVAKERLIGHFLRGRSIDALRAAGARFAAGPLTRLERAATLERLRAHRAAGETCVLVSASLDLYLAPWARTAGFDHVLCSALELDPDGRVTGRLAPRNCYGPEKARRVLEWLDGRVPSRISAYGDSRGDLELLEMADAPHWVGAAARRPPSRRADRGPSRSPRAAPAQNREAP